MLMKRFMIILCATLISTGFAYAEKPQSEKDKVSYVFGHNVGENMKKSNMELDIDFFIMGLTSGLAGNESLFTKEEAKDLLIRFQQQMAAAKFNKNKEKEDQFLTTNSMKKGINQTTSGLQYKIIKEGSGKKPALTSKVTVHYKGTLLSGKVFDSSYKRGKPATFPLNGVVKGWQEALQLMKEGAKWRLFIPAKLGYGKRGAGRIIGPGAMLIFDIELIKVD
jgi:FKBP-type peptidyl-prolyl cis-trans isomerase FklB